MLYVHSFECKIKFDALLIMWFALFLRWFCSLVVHLLSVVCTTVVGTTIITLSLLDITDGFGGTSLAIVVLSCCYCSLLL